MEALKLKTPAAGEQSEGTFQKVRFNNNTTIQVFPYYESHSTQEPAKFISLDDLAYGVAFEGPRIGPKETAPLITPFKANGKT
jgi:hypothetical protein